MKLHLHRFSFAGFPRAAVWWAAAAVLLGAFAPPLRAQSPGNFSTLTANSNVTLSGNFVDIYANDLQFGNYAAGNTSNPGYGSFYNDNGAGNIANVTLVGGRSAVAWLWQEGGNSTVAQMLLDENGNLTVYSGSNNITLNPSVPSITLGNSGNSETLAPLIGTVAANNLPRWSGSGLENGTITDNGTAVGVNTTALSSTFTVNGTTSLKGNVTLSGNGTSLVFADGSVQATSATANVTSGYIPRMTSTGYANGIMQDNGSGIGIGAPPQSGFAIFMEDSNSANLTTNLTEISAQAANFPTVPTNAQMTGLDGQAVWGGNQSSSSGYAVAGYFQSTGTTVSPGLLGVSIGVQSLAENDNSGTINWAYGGDFAVNNVYTGSIGYAYGAWLSVANQHTGNIAHAYGLGLQNMSQFGGSINNDYGVYIYPPYVDSNSTIGNNYGLYIANQTVATGANYAIYVAGSPSYFGGNLGLGNTSADSALTVTGGNIHLTTNGTAIVLSGNATGIKFGDGSLLTSANTVSTLSGPGGSPTNALSINSNGNVTLSDALSVNGTGSFNGTVVSTGLSVNGTSNFTGAMEVSSGSAGAPAVYFGANTSTGFYAPASNTLALDTNGSERIFVDNNGNVGIGTGNTTLSNTFTVNGTANFTGNLQAGSGLTTVNVSAPANNSLSLSANGQTPLWVGQNGNVGINNNDPNYTLDINGTIGSSSGQDLNIATIDNSESDSGNAGNVNLTAGNDSNGDSSPGNINITAGSDAADSFNDASVYINGGDTASNGDVVIGNNQSGIVVIGNNANPLYNLDVVGNIGSSGGWDLNLQTADSDYAAVAGNDYAGSINLVAGSDTDGNSNPGDISITAGSDQTDSGNSDGSVYINGGNGYGGAGNVILANSQSGFVGIGNSTPDNELTVSGGNIHITDGNTGIIFPDGSMLTSAALSTLSNSTVEALLGNVCTAMSFCSTGGNMAIGIGASNMSNVVTLNAATTIAGTLTATSDIAVSAGNSSAPGISFNGSTSTGLYAPAANSITLEANGTTVLTASASGNLSISSNTVTYSSNTTVVMNKRQGDIVMGVFGNGSGD